MILKALLVVSITAVCCSVAPVVVLKLAGHEPNFPAGFAAGFAGGMGAGRIVTLMLHKKTSDNA